MKNILAIVILVLGLSACGDSDSDKPKTEPNIDKFSSLRGVIEHELNENNAVAVSVAIYHQGEIVFAEAFGEKSKGSGELATPDTLFQLGSTTKMHTGLATLQLVEQGLLRIEDKLVNVLPHIQYPSVQSSTWQDVSIQHLLTHQGGFSDTNFGADSDSLLIEYMTSIYPQQNGQMNPPGLFYNYSNPNWSYLGAIIENTTQESFAEHMKNSVFEPLGMQRTSLKRSEVISDGDYALGFQTIDGVEIFLTDINQIPSQPSMTPAGSETWSTPKEQLKMADFLLNGNADVLSEQWRAEIVKPHVEQNFAGLPEYYGYGIRVDDGFMHNDQWYPEKIWSHGGNTTAYTSAFWILPEKNIAVSIMSSGAFNSFDASMVEAINAVTELPTAQAIPYSQSNPNEYEKHEGIYIAGKNDDFTVFVNKENDSLKITIPELDANNIPYDNTLTAIGGDTFWGVIENEQMFFTFLAESEGGESVYLRSRDIVAIKAGY